MLDIISSSAFIFPGQGSQQVGMLSEFAGERVFQQTFSLAGKVLGLDLLQMITEGPAEALNRTENTQPALLAASIALWRCWLDRGGFKPSLMAGHSLGEYSALVAAEAIDFKDALLLVQKRGQLMEQAVPEGQGSMAAILGLEDQVVIEACAEASNSGEGIAESANFNAPGQVVIAGNIKALQIAVEICKSKGAKKAIQLPVSVPSHCQLMRPAAEDFADSLKGLNVIEPAIAVVQNFDAEISNSPETIKQKLLSQLTSPVLWVQCILKMSGMAVNQLFECGPGNVLTALNKRIDRSLQSTRLSKSEQFKVALSYGEQV